MKNSKNKVIAGIVCGLIIGSVGTSCVGNFQSAQQTNIAKLKREASRKHRFTTN